MYLLPEVVLFPSETLKISVEVIETLFPAQSPAQEVYVFAQLSELPSERRGRNRPSIGSLLQVRNPFSALHDGAHFARVIGVIEVVSYRVARAERGQGEGGIGGRRELVTVILSTPPNPSPSPAYRLLHGEDFYARAINPVYLQQSRLRHPSRLSLQLWELLYTSLLHNQVSVSSLPF